jgi:deoxyribonuclease-4
VNINSLLFGTAGVPISTPKPSSINGVKQVKALGLDAMEMEFVRGVKMSRETALEVKRVSVEEGVVLTAHAPYYVNLNSPDESKVKASIRRILDTARITYTAGGWSIVFHAAYYGEEEPKIVYDRVNNALEEVIKALRDEGVKIWVRPETSGGLAEFGCLEEVLALSQSFEEVLPCIDFAHLHARSIGRYNKYGEIASIFEQIEEKLGKEALNNMHMHFSGIIYGERGELKHVNLEESDYNYHDLVKALKDFNIKGVIISESPNIEGDAILLKNKYKGI